MDTRSILGMIHAEEALLVSIVRSLPPDIRSKVANDFHEQAEIAEEDVDILAVGDGRWRCGAVGVLKLLFTRPRRFTTPQDFSRLAVEAQSEQLLVFRSCQKDSIGSEYRRGMSGRDGRFPGDILPGREFRG